MHGPVNVKFTHLFTSIFYAMGLVTSSEALSRQQSSQAVKLTVHLHLVSRLRLRGAMPPQRQILT